MDREETIAVDPDTGGRKAEKLSRPSLIPVVPLLSLAEHFGRGAKKYDDRNWELGYAWHYSYDSLMRHLLLFWGGEDIDAETGSHHLDAVIWHAMVLREFVETHPEKDDRGRKVNFDEPTGS